MNEFLENPIKILLFVDCVNKYKQIIHKFVLNDRRSLSDLRDRFKQII